MGDDQFPGFTEVVEIGSGGIATVFRARESDTNRFVALKRLNVRDAAPRAVESFERESIALGALSSHPNIVTLYRTFRMADGRPVLVLELCASSVAERLHGGGRIPVQEATSIAIKVAGALETAHRAHILHRDVKPGNILITEFGEPALADFGVAMLQSSTQTTAGLFDFTTLHAAPELLEGGETSARTDVYELASTLYQLIAGQSAFRSYDGESPASVILRILRDPVLPVTSADVPVRLSDLLIRAMSKKPDARPPTAAEFAAELSAIEAEQAWPRTQALIRDSAYARQAAAPRAGAAPAIARLPAPAIARLPAPPVPASLSVPVPASASADPITAPIPVIRATIAPEPAAPPVPPAPTLPAAPLPVAPLPVAPLPAAPPPAQAVPPPSEPEAPPRPTAVVQLPEPPSSVVDIDEADVGVPDDFQLPLSPRDKRAAELVAEHAAEAPIDQANAEAYPIPPAAWTPFAAPADVPVYAFRGAPNPLRSVSLPMVEGLTLDPMSLRPRATLRAGFAAVKVDEHHLTERLNLHRNRIPWSHVYGFEAQPESPAEGSATHGSLTAVTSRGPVPLKATRRPLAELGHLQALLDAYRIRAQLLSNV